MMSVLRSTYEKNWPEVHAALTGSQPRFMYAKNPADLGTTIPVFCYHLFRKKEFEADLKFLCDNNYVTISADDLVQHLEGSREAPPRSIVITVDDGSRNLYDVGYPLVMRFGVRAVAFIAAGFHAEETSADFMRYESRPCTWDEIRSMQASGCIDFQSHSLEHRYVPRWPERVRLTGADPDLIDSLCGPDRSIREDFDRSRKVIEEKLQKDVRHLCFVKYQGSAQAVALGKECGFKSFWWGYLPNHSGNKPGQSPDRIARVDAEYLRRLPGSRRESLRRILRARYGGTLRRILGQPPSDEDRIAANDH